MAKRRMAVGLLLVMATFALASSASAGLLANGTSNAADAFIAPTGITVANTGVLAWASATMSGTYQELVVRETGGVPNLPCGGSFGCLDFIIKVTSASTSVDAIGRITASNFASGFLIDAGYQIPASGTAPLTVDRSVNGQVIGFNFAPGVTPGTSTATLEIQTNATSFTTGTLTMFDTTGSPPEPAFAPSVPEPSSLLLLGFGLVGLGYSRARRRQ